VRREVFLGNHGGDHRTRWRSLLRKPRVYPRILTGSFAPNLRSPLMGRKFQAAPWNTKMIEVRQTTEFGRKRCQRQSCRKAMRMMLSLLSHGHPTAQPKKAASQRCGSIPRLSRCTTSSQSKCAARPSRCDESGIPSSFSHTKQRRSARATPPSCRTPSRRRPLRKRHGVPASDRRSRPRCAEL